MLMGEFEMVCRVADIRITNGQLNSCEAKHVPFRVYRKQRDIVSAHDSLRVSTTNSRSSS